MTSLGKNATFIITKWPVALGVGVDDLPEKKRNSQYNIVPILYTRPPRSALVAQFQTSDDTSVACLIDIAIMYYTYFIYIYK